MIQYLQKKDGKLLQLEELQENCWVNIYPPFDQEELDGISQRLGIPMDFLVDSLDIDERSRFEREDDVDLIVLNAPCKNKDGSEHQADYITVPIGIISLDNVILTISSYQNPVIDYFLERHLRDFDPMRQKDFLLRIFDRAIYYFLIYLKRINQQRNQYTAELYNSSRNTELASMMNLQKSLVYFATTLRDNEQLMIKIQRTDFIHIRGDEEATDYLEDIIVDNSQAREMADIYNNILNGTMDAFASIISNNLNIVMKRLTAVTIILMVPTLVASFFGMNVALPLAGNPWAYGIIILVSILLSIGLVLIFMRNRLF